MPVHHIPRGRLHEDIVQLTREQHEVVSVTLDPDDAQCYIVVTSTPGEVETRPAP